MNLLLIDRENRQKLQITVIDYPALAMSLSTSEVCRLKSPGVVDWVILRLADGGRMLLLGGVLPADWLGVWEEEEADETDSLAFRFLLADGAGDSEPFFEAFFWPGIVGV